VEPSGRGGDQGEVPDGDHVVPLGSASVLRSGGDVTVVATGRMVAGVRDRHPPGVRFAD
jgi:acetoin:2,6-dichlorophenolindophenol oxidoreductase subunit beta